MVPVGRRPTVAEPDRPGSLVVGTNDEDVLIIGFVVVVVVVVAATEASINCEWLRYW